MRSRPTSLSAGKQRKMNITENVPSYTAASFKIITVDSVRTWVGTSEYKQRSGFVAKVLFNNE